MDETPITNMPETETEFEESTNENESINETADDDLIEEIQKETDAGEAVDKINDEKEPDVVSIQELQTKNTELETKLKELEQKAEIADKLSQQQDEIAKMYGFSSVQEMQNYQANVQLTNQIANYQADLYAKHIDRCEYPDEMRNLLIQYKQTPTAEILESIEAEMPLEVIKSVAEDLSGYKLHLQQHQANLQNQQEEAVLKDYLKNVTTKYKDRFNNQAFTNIFGEAFKYLGTNLQADSFVNLLDEYQKSCIQEYIKQKSTEIEDEELTDSLSSLNTSSSNVISVDNVNLDTISDKELDKIVRKLV